MSSELLGMFLRGVEEIENYRRSLEDQGHDQGYIERAVSERRAENVREALLRQSGYPVCD